MYLLVQFSFNNVFIKSRDISTNGILHSDFAENMLRILERHHRELLRRQGRQLSAQIVTKFSPWVAFWTLIMRDKR